jgi:hypothetical protein
LISQNLRDLFAKRQGAARVAGRAGHVASHEWRVHGGAVDRAHGAGEAAGRWTGSTGPWWTGHAGEASSGAAAARRAGTATPWPPPTRSRARPYGARRSTPRAPPGSARRGEDGARLTFANPAARRGTRRRRASAAARTRRERRRELGFRTLGGSGCEGGGPARASGGAIYRAQRTSVRVRAETEAAAPSVSETAGGGRRRWVPLAGPTRQRLGAAGGLGRALRGRAGPRPTRSRGEGRGVLGRKSAQAGAGAGGGEGGSGWAARGRGPRGRRCPFFFLFFFRNNLLLLFNSFSNKINTSTSKQIKQK